MPKVEVEQLEVCLRLAIEAADRKDEVKLTAAIHKLQEEDPSLHFRQNAELQEMCARRAGRDSSEGRGRKAGEQIRAQTQHLPAAVCRTRKQSAKVPRNAGGTSGNPAATVSSAMCMIEIKPMPRGTGFVFRG